jgi:hypothetical protein
MKNIIIKVLVLVSLFCLPSISFAQTGLEAFTKTSADISAELKSVLLKNFEGYQKEDIGEILTTVHTLSPGYAATKSVADQIFPVYDLKYELSSFRYLMIDGGYALARVSQITSKIKGPAFHNNQIDLIIVFKQEDGKWKLWSQVILGIEYL